MVVDHTNFFENRVTEYEVITQVYQVLGIINIHTKEKYDNERNSM